VHVARYPKGQLGWYRKAARLQTVSGPIARAAASQSPRIADRIKVIPNFVSDCLRPLGTDAYERRSKQILYVGRVHPEKGIQVLLDAFRNLRRDGFADWELVIVGPTEPRYGGGGTAYYEKLHASSTDLAAVLHWVGPVFDRELLNRYYRTASLFVYPSLAERGETFGLAPLEAMAQGCPPVVSALECFRDFIHEPEDGWIFDHRSPDAAESLGSKLRALLTDPKGRAMAATKALETARSYTLDKIADAYITDFEELLAHV
jgi:glycosyltransferase involved in cell wall biosynthesis